MATGSRRFVLLEHAWRGVHWDFMLETTPGGPLRTWAVDAEVVPGVPLPARALADHRAAYLGYEGEVSRGRGSVRRVDAGVFTAEIWTPGLVRVRVRGAQLVGFVELRESASRGADDGPPGWTFHLALGNFD